MRKVRLVLFDGNEMTRTLLRYVLDGLDDVEIVGATADLNTATELARQFEPDAVIVGYDLPSHEEFELRSFLRQDCLNTQVIELSELDKTVAGKLDGKAEVVYQQSVMVH